MNYQIVDSNESELMRILIESRALGELINGCYFVLTNKFSPAEKEESARRLEIFLKIQTDYSEEINRLRQKMLDDENSRKQKL